MTIDGDVLEIELDMELDEVAALREFVAKRLEYIEAIEMAGSRERFVSSSLFALLHSIKKSKPEMAIPLIDAPFELGEYGKLYWGKP